MRCKVDTVVGVMDLDILTPDGVRPPDTDRATYIDGPPTRGTVDPGPPVKVTYVREDGQVDRVWVEGVGYVKQPAAL